MSLDVYLIGERQVPRAGGTGIFVRDNGEMREISRTEWDARFPGCEPVIAEVDDDSEVYWRNITHNLSRMAAKAGIYEHLWRPDEIGITKASELIEPLRGGLARLRADPQGFRVYNPPNGWGDYDGLIAFVESYLTACEAYPSATIHVSR